MPNPDETRLLLAKKYHARLPKRIRAYLNSRGITDRIIDQQRLGWNGCRITIPVHDRNGGLAFFRFAKAPNDHSDAPKVVSSPGSQVDLYGWECLSGFPPYVIICEGEFDRLVLLSRGFNAVTSTGGALTFKTEWVDAFRRIREVYLCFDNDFAGEFAVQKIGRLLPQARVIRLPPAVGHNGDVTDYFVKLHRTPDEFQKLMVEAKPLVVDNLLAESAQRRFHARRAMDSEIERLKAENPIHEIISRYLPLQRVGLHYVGHCPFHPDRHPSFTVYPASGRFHCFGCREHGDVIDFLMKHEHLGFTPALELLRDQSNGYGGQRQAA